MEVSALEGLGVVSSRRVGVCVGVNEGLIDGLRVRFLRFLCGTTYVPLHTMLAGGEADMLHVVP